MHPIASKKKKKEKDKTKGKPVHHDAIL